MDYKKVIETLQCIYNTALAMVEKGGDRGVIYINLHRISDLKDAISSVQDMQEIHNNGISIEHLKDIDFRKQVVEHINHMDYMAIKDELEEYKQLGTLEEVREAVEKQHPEEPMRDCVYKHQTRWCAKCKRIVIRRWKHCPICGQKLDWSEKDD